VIVSVAYFTDTPTGARMFDGRPVILSSPRMMIMRLTPSLPGMAVFNAACSTFAMGLYGCGIASGVAGGGVTGL